MTHAHYFSFFVGIRLISGMLCYFFFILFALRISIDVFACGASLSFRLPFLQLPVV